MANKVLLKKSSTAAKTPLVTDLDYGELALNYADGKLYYKTSGNTIDTFPSLSATATLTNKTLTSPTLTTPSVTGLASFTTTTTANAVSITYTPSATSGAALFLTGKDSQGGTGYFDFLKVTNTTSGATNSSKSVRLNSTGGLEIINSAYTTNIFTLNDAGQLTVPSLSLAGTITDSLSSVGTNGQILQSTGTGVKWVTSSAGSSGTVTSVAATVPAFLSVSGSPITTSGTLAISLSGTALPLANGGTGATSAAGAQANLMGWTSTTASATPLVLTNTSTYQQIIANAASNQTITLPSTATLQTGWSFSIINATGFLVTVQTSTGVTVYSNSNIGGYRVWVNTTANNNSGSWGAAVDLISFETGSGSMVRATSPSISSPTISNPTVTGTLTAGGSAGTNGYFLQSTGSGVQWAQATSTSVFTANAQSDLGYVYDSVVLTEDLGTPLGTTTTSYDLAVLRVDGVVSLENLDSSVKSDYLAQAIIFGF